MSTTYVPTLDHAALTAGLRETCDRLRQLCQAADEDLSVFESDVNWLELYDLLDRVKDRSEQVIRPAPRPLVDVYVRTRTWLREIPSAPPQRSRRWIRSPPTRHADPTPGP